MSKELRDRVAKAIAAVDGHKLGQMAPAITSLYFARADAAIALVLEEAAKACGLSSVGLHFATAIRALKEKP